MSRSLEAARLNSKPRASIAIAPRHTKRIMSNQARVGGRGRSLSGSEVLSRFPAWATYQHRTLNKYRDCTVWLVRHQQHAHVKQGKIRQAWKTPLPPCLRDSTPNGPWSCSADIGEFEGPDWTPKCKELTVSMIALIQTCTFLRQVNHTSMEVVCGRCQSSLCCASGGS